MKDYLIYNIFATLAACAMPLCASAQDGNVPANMNVLDPNVVVNWSADTLKLAFPLCETKEAGGSNFAVWDMPQLGSADGDTLTLAPAVFRGKRNMHYVERERHFAGKSYNRRANHLVSAPLSWRQRSNNEVLLGDTILYNVAIARSQKPWLWEKPTTLSLRREKDGCCSTDDLEPATLASLMYIPPFIPQLAVVPDNTGKAGELEKDNPVLRPYSEYRPYTKDRILRKEEGVLYVHFELDKILLKHNFRNNGQILDQIVDITRQIMQDSTSNVKVIQIVGLASVEGSVAHNEWLAGNRAVALKRYIQQHVKTPDALFEVANGGEAWTELRSQIEDLHFEGRDEMLRIIDTEKDVNVRERKLKSLMGGKPYSYLRENVLSDQRNSGYLRIYYDYVPDTAAAVINRATELIEQQRYDEALRQLKTVSNDKRALNALGVAYYMTDDKQQGMECIRRAAQHGNQQAKENLKQWEAIKKAESMAE